MFYSFSNESKETESADNVTELTVADEIYLYHMFHSKNKIKLAEAAYTTVHDTLLPLILGVVILCILQKQMRFLLELYNIQFKLCFTFYYYSLASPHNA